MITEFGCGGCFRLVRACYYYMGIYVLISYSALFVFLLFPISLKLSVLIFFISYFCYAMQLVLCFITTLIYYSLS